MQARCPRCAAVFTTDRSGLQFCPNCGQQVDVPPFPGAPAESGAGWGGPSGPGGPGSHGPGPAVREDTPWERRSTVGWLTGLWETWKRTVFGPQSFWASVKPDGSWTDALIYAWILFALGLIVSAPLGPLGLGRWGYEAALAQMRDLPPGVRTMLHNFAGLGTLQLVTSAVFYPLGLIIYAAILHLSCMLLGAGKNGYYATFRVVAYASATNVIGMLPCLGFIAGLYGIVLAILGISSVQETTLGRAAAAVLLPLLVVVCCGCAVVGIAGAGLASMLGQFQGQ
jgi:hypothetical protein